MTNLIPRNYLAPFPCRNRGKLLVRVAVNTGRWPLTSEKWLGFRVERCHIWEMMIVYAETVYPKVPYYLHKKKQGYANIERLVGRDESDGHVWQATATCCDTGCILAKFYYTGHPDV